MSLEELMQNDWVQNRQAPHLLQGEILHRGRQGHRKDGRRWCLRQAGRRAESYRAVQDTILCTPFWLVRKGVFKKVIRNVVSFVYETGSRRLVVEVAGMGVVNVHYIGFMHELQHLYRHYTGNALEVDMMNSKRKEYSKRYYHKEG